MERPPILTYTVSVYSDRGQFEPRGKLDRVDTEVLIIECAGFRFGVRSTEVIEVVRAVAVSPALQMPKVVLGVINLRGRVVPVLNSRVLLDLPPTDLDHTHQFVIVRAGDGLLAMHVDRAIDLIQVEPDQIESETRLVQFTAKTRFGIVSVLLPEKFLSEQESQTVRMVTSNTATESNP